MKMKSLFYSTLLIFIVFACNPEEKQKSGSISDPISKEYHRLVFKTDSAWTSMMNSEDRKLENIALIIKELGLIDGSSAEHLEQIKLQLEELKTNQYTRISMANSAMIDRYDSLTNALIFEIRKEINNNKEAIKYQVVNQLISEIQTADDSVLFLRKSYDRQIDDYRAYLDQNKEKLLNLIPNLDSLKNLNYFRINP